MNLGGVGIWVRDNLEYTEMSSPFTSKQIESATIKLPKLNTIIINIYRPFGNTHTFITELYEHIKSIRKDFSRYNICVVSDFNINLLTDSLESRSLLETMTLEGFIQSVTLPTRITESTKTLIDHVYSRSRRKVHTDVIATGLSDHEMTFTIFEDKVKKIK